MSEINKASRSKCSRNPNDQCHIDRGVSFVFLLKNVCRRRGVNISLHILKKCFFFETHSFSHPSFSASSKRGFPSLPLANSFWTPNVLWVVKHLTSIWLMPLPYVTVISATHKSIANKFEKMRFFKQRN